MAISSRSDRPSGPVLRSLSPGRFKSLTARASTAIESSASPLSAMASDFAMSSGFYSPSASSFFGRRPSSPTRVNLSSSPPQLLSSSSVRFSMDGPVSPRRSFAVSPRHPVINSRGGSIGRKTCMCSPTSHPGSFRCSLHRHSGSGGGGGGGGGGSGHSDSFVPNRLIMLRSAMRNRIVSIGGVEGDLVMRALTALIRPSSHQQRRLGAFRPRPSRLSAMSKAAAAGISNQVDFTRAEAGEIRACSSGDRVNSGELDYGRGELPPPTNRLLGGSIVGGSIWLRRSGGVRRER
ncbi:hypothetical protein NL676_034142 [Syzygium grande]|nr:hypothetical protein NL676_034142 [Syzygium grande]